MWHELEVEQVSKIRKCVGEFEVWMHQILPYGKMKIKIHEEQNKTYTGKTDICIKRKFDGQAECAVGFGESIEEALEETIIWFKKMVEEDYPTSEYPMGLEAEHIEYSEYSDF